YGNYYYTLYSQGFLTCHDARMGEQVYGRKRVATDAGAFTASPWAYNGRIFAANEDGDTYVIQAGPEYKLLGKNTLGEMVLGAPAPFACYAAARVNTMGRPRVITSVSS